MIIGLNYHRYHGRSCSGGHPVKGFTSEAEERKKGWKRCKCPIIASGSLNRAHKRVSTKQTDWAAAAQLMAPYIAANSWEIAPPPEPTDPGPDPDRKPKDREPVELVPCGEGVTVERACQDYERAHVKAKSAVATMRAKRYLLRDLIAFAAAHNIGRIDEWTPATVRAFADTWGEIGLRTRAKNMANVKAFFEFCLQQEYQGVTRNVARIKEIKNRATKEEAGSLQGAPFTDEELYRMLDGCRRFGQAEARAWPKKKDGRQVPAINEWKDYNRRRSGEDMMDFICVSAWTGLRISDVVLFDIARLRDDNMCAIKAMKNGAWVYSKLPAWLADRLRERAKQYGPLVFGPYQSKRIDTLTNTWRNNLKELWEECGPWSETPKPHRFRYTFIRILLASGTPLHIVADLAGDSPDTITRYYRVWVPELQDAISTFQENAFAGMPNPYRQERGKVLELKRG